MGDLARWIHIRDGLRDVIKYLPVGERSTEAALQRLWAVADMKVEALRYEGGGEWLIPH